MQDILWLEDPHAGLIFMDVPCIDIPQSFKKIGTENVHQGFLSNIVFCKRHQYTGFHIAVRIDVDGNPACSATLCKFGIIIEVNEKKRFAGPDVLE